MSTTVETATAIRPFHAEFSEEQIDDLRRRIAATRWPTRELVADRSQGVQLAAMQELARYWLNEYDFAHLAERLNELPQFVTEIDGVDIHFIHVRSAHEDALPLIITHGWPGSIVELLETVGPLSDPTAHGGRAEDAFDLVLPSIPGYGLSGKPTELGWIPPIRVARAWAELMHRLGYTRYVAQGGDVGAAVTHGMGQQAPDGLIGIHTNLFFPALAEAKMPEETDEEKAAPRSDRRLQSRGLRLLPRAGDAAADDRLRIAGLAHRAGSVDGRPRHRRLLQDRQRLRRRQAVRQPHARPHPRQHHAVLAHGDWGIGRAIVLGGRPELASDDAAAPAPPPPVSLPVGFTTFPGEIWKTPRSWVETAYPNVVYFNEVDKGGHFAAWEEPELFSQELRAAFKSLR